MKHTKKELEHKKFIQAKNRLNQIYKEISKLPITPVKEPYQSGWKLIPALREDYLKSSRAEIVKPLVDKLGRSIVIRNPKWVTQIRKKPQLDNCTQIVCKSRYCTVPHIATISEKKYQQLTDREKKHFDKCDTKPDTDRYKLNVPSHYLVVKVEKNIITHKKEIDPILLQEEAELKKILQNYWRKSSFGYDRWNNYFEKRSNRRQSKIDLQKIDINN